MVPFSGLSSELAALHCRPLRLFRECRSIDQGKQLVLLPDNEPIGIHLVVSRNRVLVQFSFLAGLCPLDVVFQLPPFTICPYSLSLPAADRMVGRAHPLFSALPGGTELTGLSR